MHSRSADAAQPRLARSRTCWGAARSTRTGTRGTRRGPGSGRAATRRTPSGPGGRAGSAWRQTTGASSQPPTIRGGQKSLKSESMLGWEGWVNCQDLVLLIQSVFCTDLLRFCNSAMWHTKIAHNICRFVNIPFGLGREMQWSDWLFQSYPGIAVQYHVWSIVSM